MLKLKALSKSISKLNVRKEKVEIRLDIVKIGPGVNKKPQKFIFAYWVFSQKSYLNVGCFEKIHICIPEIRYLHTSSFAAVCWFLQQNHC